MKTQALPARPADRRLYFAGLVWLGVAILYTFLLPQLPHRAADYNFDLYYVSGVAAIRGLNPAITDIAPLGRSLGCHMPQKYFANSTPFFRIIFDGLAHLSLLTAYRLWVGTGAMAFAGAIVMLMRMVHMSTRTGVLVLGLLLLYPPVISHLWYAESEFLILFLLALGLRFLRRGRDIEAGAVLAFAALLKVYPVIIGWHLIAFRRWKALASAAAAGLAGVAISGLFFGVGASTGLVALDAHDLFLWNFYNLSLPAFLTHTYWRVATVYNYPNAPAWVLVIAELGLVAITYAMTNDRSPEAESQCYALWAVASLLFSPIVWLAYLPLLAIPIIEVVAAIEKGRNRRRSLYLLLLSSALLFVLMPFLPGVPGVTEHSWSHGLNNNLAADVQCAALALAYLSVCWLVVDPKHSAGGRPPFNPARRAFGSIQAIRNYMLQSKTTSKTDSHPRSCPNLKPPVERERVAWQRKLASKYFGG